MIRSVAKNRKSLALRKTSAVVETHEYTNEITALSQAVVTNSNTSGVEYTSERQQLFSDIEAAITKYMESTHNHTGVI